MIARRTLRNGTNPDSYLLIYQLICLGISIPPAIIALQGTTMLERTPGADELKVWLIVVLAMTAWSVFGVATFRSAATLDVSISATIATSKYLWAALLGVAMFGETLTVVHIAGLAVIVFANMALHRFPAGRLNTAGVAYALIASLSLSVAIALDKTLLEHLDPAIVLLLGFAGSTATSLLLNRKARLADIRGVASSAVLAALAGAAGYYFLLVSLQSGDLSVVVPIYQSSHIVLVLAGIVFLKETVGIRPKLVAAAISAVGGVLVYVGS